MQQILISKHACSAVQVASVTATLVFEKKHGTGNTKGKQCKWKGPLTKGLYLAPCDWLKKTALITNFKFDANFRLCHLGSAFVGDESLNER